MWLGLLWAVAPPRAHAQEDLPDVVRLEDGSFVRGTIIERTEGDRVVVDVMGQLRTYPASEVAYAGPYPEPDLLALESETPDGVPGARHRLNIVGDAGVRLFVEIGVDVAMDGDAGEPVAHYEPLCIAPCRAELSHGRHRVALSDEGGNTTLVRALEVERDLSLRLRLVERSDMRLVGGLVVLAGIVPALVLISAGLLGLRDGSVDGGLVGAGAGFAVLSIIGIPLATWGDTRAIEILE